MCLVRVGHHHVRAAAGRLTLSLAMTSPLRRACVSAVPRRISHSTEKRVFGS